MIFLLLPIKTGLELGIDRTNWKFGEHLNPTFLIYIIFLLSNQLSMKKLQQCLMVMSLVSGLGFIARAESITSRPSPAVTNKVLEVTIQTDQDLGSTVYCYTWCKSINGEEKIPSWSWTDVHNSKFQMTGSACTYTFKISDIKSFYELTDSELAGLTELGFIVKNESGSQTGDFYVSVVQGRTDAYSGGEGTQDNPFILKNVEDLKEFASTSIDWAEDVYLRLDADIDASSLDTPIASKGSPFCGHFDGAGHSISNLRLTETAVGEAVGLFGGLKDGEIKNLGVVDADITGTTYAGILVGYATSGTIKACYTTGKVNANSVCTGGLVGDNAGAVISDCYSGAAVSNTADCAVGGLVGKNAGVIQNVYASGPVKGLDFVAGVAGANYGNIRHSVALNSSVTSSMNYSARFSGNSDSRSIVSDNNAWTDITPGHGSWSAHGYSATLRSADDLSTLAFFRLVTGWDFDDIWEWRTESGKSYPALRKISGQTNVIPVTFYDSLSGLVDVAVPGVFVSVGPNPVTSTLIVSSTETLAACQIFSVNGAIIANIVPADGVSEVAVDMSTVAPGLYIVNVMTASGFKSVNKIIKK